jgi:hypothetical protein
MDIPVTIPPQAPLNKGLDYVYLRERGVRICQALSSDIWTDYNEHDPGVTTLEQLCYALTELSYRAELPFTDLFADRETGDIQARRHGMFIARRILPCNPVTENDYRKLLVDRVPAVRNVWLTPRIPAAGSTEVNGLYDIEVYAPQADECTHDCNFRPKEILEKVRQTYSRYRNLCEDLHSVRLLHPLRTVVHADVSIGHAQPAAKILAAILFAVGNRLAPELARKPLNYLLDKGETPDRIFNGPLLLHGFIEDEELQPREPSVAVNEVIRVVAQTPGVAGVRNLTVQTGPRADSESYRANDSIPVPADRFLHLDTKPGPAGNGFTIRLYRNGVLCNPDPHAVERELSALWAGCRRSYPLEAQYEEYFGVPSGEWRDLERYYSIQNQYPGVYGIGSFGLPPDATVARQGQARQFKAYLLPFEQLMADYFAQLAHVGDLFSIASDSAATYYWQSLVKSVPQVEPILKPGYREGLNKIVCDGDNVVGRRNRFVEFLLSLYANELHAQGYNGDSGGTHNDCGSGPQSRQKMLRGRLKFLHVLVSATRSRGRGFDYMAHGSARNFAGMEIKCRIELGLDLEEHQPLNEALGKSRFAIARGPSDASLGQSEARDSSYMDEHFLPIAAYPEPQVVPEISSILKGSSATEEFVACAHDPNNLYVGKLPGEETWVLVCKMPGSGWVPIDVHELLESALRGAHALSRHLKTIHHARTQLYIVEHALLRFGRRSRRKKDHFVYSFTITAVVALPHAQRMNRDNRTIVEEIIRENTPANTVADVCFLDPWAMIRFEFLLGAWRSALRRGRSFPLALTSARLRRFLERHRHTTPSTHD